MFMRGYKLSQQACVATVLSLEGHSTQKRHPSDAVFHVWVMVAELAPLDPEEIQHGTELVTPNPAPVRMATLDVG